MRDRHFLVTCPGPSFGQRRTNGNAHLRPSGNTWDAVADGLAHHRLTTFEPATSSAVHAMQLSPMTRRTIDPMHTGLPASACMRFSRHYPCPGDTMGSTGSQVLPERLRYELGGGDPLGGGLGCELIPEFWIEPDRLNSRRTGAQRRSASPAAPRHEVVNVRADLGLGGHRLDVYVGDRLT